MIIPKPAIEKNNNIKAEPMKLYVRYMVCLRCKMILKKELRKLEIKYAISPYGAIEFLEEVSAKKVAILKKNLKKSGLELLNIQESKLIDRIINTIIEVIHYFDELPKLHYAEILNEKLGMENKPVLKIFSDVIGISIIQFIVLQKIERVKELLLYDNLSTAEITKLLNYKSEELMINQFKKYTGLTPEHFMEFKNKRIKIISQKASEAKA
jgi:AraC-like DNA-binding protein